MNFNGIDFDTYFKNYPNKEGYFGPYGGAYVNDDLKKAMAEINDAYFTICKSRKFIDELRRIRKEFQGRPTPITHLERLSNSIGNGVQLYVKREDLNHTGAHKLNHCMGEALLAKYMGEKKLTAETGAGVELSGTTNMLNYPEYSDVQKAKNFLAVLESKDKLRRLVGREGGMEVTIRIGPENEIPELSDCSILTASYRVGDQSTGTIGIIGPTRMNYNRVIPVLDFMGRAISELLSGQQKK